MPSPAVPCRGLDSLSDGRRALVCVDLVRRPCPTFDSPEVQMVDTSRHDYASGLGSDDCQFQCMRSRAKAITVLYFVVFE
jgi:hypothetical protein